MDQKKSKLLNIIRGGKLGPVFSSSDRVDVTLKFNTIIDNEDSLDKDNLCKNNDLVEEVKSILCAGPRWYLNPSCVIFEKNMDTQERMYDKSILVNFIKEKSKINIRMLDVNSRVLETNLPISIFYLNTKDIPDHVFLDSTNIEIHTLMGKIKLK